MEQREENEACFDYPESRQRKAIAKEEDAVKTVKFLSFSLSFQLFTCIEPVEPTTNRAQNDACISSVEVRRRKTEG